MELTGAAKEAFEKWYLFTYLNRSKAQTDISHVLMFEFNGKKDSEKWGVYVDWFDSVGYHLSITFDGFDEFGWEVDMFKETITCPLWMDTRPEARTEAIKKGDELFNNQER